MYRTKVIIADDEEMTLDSIKFVIDKYLPELDVVAQCQNGKAILDFLDKNHADILIMDIRMPIIDGIEVLKTLHEASNKIKTVLITAHKNFEYAYQAIQYGCESFLTKPIDYEKMIEVIKNICIKNEQQASSAYKEAERILEKRSQERKALFYFYNRLFEFEDLMRDNSGIEGIDNECAIIHLKTNTEISNSAIIDICEINNDFLNAFFLCMEGQNIELLVLSKCESPLSFRMHIDLFLNDICNIFNTSYNTKIEREVRWLSSFRNANSISEEKDIDEISDIALQYITDFVSEKQIYRYIFRFSFDECKIIANDIVRKVSERFNSDFEYFAEQIESDITKSDICAFLSDFKAAVQKDKDYKIYRVRQYIFDNCTNDLQLGEVAELFGYNYYYFSRIFREKNGRGFLEFIVHARIEKAKQLLLRGKDIDEVAGEVGYEVNYFKKRFKKETGKTVKEFLGVSDEEDI